MSLWTICDYFKHKPTVQVKWHHFCVCINTNLHLHWMIALLRQAWCRWYRYSRSFFVSFIYTFLIACASTFFCVWKFRLVFERSCIFIWKCINICIWTGAVFVSENASRFVFELKLYLYLNVPGRGRMIWQVLQFWNWHPAISVRTAPPIAQGEISRSVAFPTHVWKKPNICKHVILWFFHTCVPFPIPMCQNPNMCGKSTQV